jgi:hypothetical protein
MHHHVILDPEVVYSAPGTRFLNEKLRNVVSVNINSSAGCVYD